MLFASHLHHMIASSVVCRDHAAVPFVMPFQDHDACFIHFTDSPARDLALVRAFGKSLLVPRVLPHRSSLLKQGFHEMHRSEKVVGEHVMVLVEVVGNQAHHHPVANVEVRLTSGSSQPGSQCRGSPAGCPDERRHCLQNICTGLVASGRHLNQFMQTVYAAIPTPTRRHSTTYNNISPCSNDGVINSPVAIKSFLLTARGNALRLRSTHRAVSALGSAFTRVGATILSATYMYGTDGKRIKCGSIHADNVHSHPSPTRRHEYNQQQHITML